MSSEFKKSSLSDWRIVTGTVVLLGLQTLMLWAKSFDLGFISTFSRWYLAVYI